MTYQSGILNFQKYQWSFILASHNIVYWGEAHTLLSVSVLLSLVIGETVPQVSMGNDVVSVSRINSQTYLAWPAYKHTKKAFF